MKVKLDENLPEALAALEHDVDNVRQEGLAGRNDPDAWAAAQAAGRFFLPRYQVEDLVTEALMEKLCFAGGGAEPGERSDPPAAKCNFPEKVRYQVLNLVTRNECPIAWETVLCLAAGL